MAAGVPRTSSHGLRHTYVSWMIDEGHSAEKIAVWIGDTPDTVRTVYAHMLEASSVPAAASIDAALSGLVWDQRPEQDANEADDARGA